MTNLIVKIFLLSAVLVSIIACKWPQLLTPGKPLVEPLLGVIMLGMGTTLSVKDFRLTAKRLRHETVFQQDCQKAFELGKRLVGKA